MSLRFQTLAVDISPCRRQTQIVILLQMPYVVYFLSIFLRFSSIFKGKFIINKTSAEVAGPRPQLTKNPAGLRAFGRRTSAGASGQRLTTHHPLPMRSVANHSPIPGLPSN